MNELQHVNYAVFGLLGLIFWIVGFFYWFKKPQLFIPSKYKKKGIPVLRSLIFIMGVIGWLYISYALAGPRKPLGIDKNTIEVNDIYIVLDLSRSMLAEDLIPNRFEASKKKIQEFVALFPRDRIGIVLFAEKVFTFSILE